MKEIEESEGGRGQVPGLEKRGGEFRGRKVRNNQERPDLFV